MKIKCQTLFDITRTNVNPRRRSIIEEIPDNYELQCGQQSNFETVQQVISLRSQPEDITTPIMSQVKLDKKSIWGTKYQERKSTVSCWSFEFTIAHTAAFRSGDDELGTLLIDCEGVPMISGLNEWNGLGEQLSSSIELKNIHFEIIA